MHKQKGKYKYFSAGGAGQWKFFFWQLDGEAGTWWYQGVVRTSGTDLGLEHSVVVLRMVCRWPAFDPLLYHTLTSFVYLRLGYINTQPYFLN